MEPFVSIVILTMKEPVAVLECLNNQTYQNFETILAQEKGWVHALNNDLNPGKGDKFVKKILASVDNAPH